MENNYSTNAIVLKKIPFNNYDEKILFLTENFGKILLMSYGSRSNRSRRKLVLSSLDFSKIYFVCQNGYFILKKVISIHSNSFLLKDTKNYLLFTNFIKTLLHVFPLQEISTKEYNFFFVIFFFLIKNYSNNSNNLKRQKIEVLFFMINFSLLKSLGIFPYFSLGKQQSKLAKHSLKKSSLEKKIIHKKKINQLYFFLEKLTEIIQVSNQTDNQQKKIVKNFNDQKYQEKIFCFFYNQYSSKEEFISKSLSLAKKIIVDYIN